MNWIKLSCGWINMDNIVSMSPRDPEDRSVYINDDPPYQTRLYASFAEGDYATCTETIEEILLPYRLMELNEKNK